MIRETANDILGWTAADIVNRFGEIPIARVCMDPAPGTAKEADVIVLRERSRRLFELADGTLVEKTVGTFEAYLASRLLILLGQHVFENKLGIVLGADGMLRLSPGLIRIPDVSFISKDRVPNGIDPNEAVATVVPNLAVEIISRGNTTREMERKLEEYFQFGAEAVWYVYPRDQAIHVFTSPEHCQIATDTLAGHNVLPEFELDVAALFARPF